eukprot:scaffold634_cov185-Ochromonas_danica.AAC.11
MREGSFELKVYPSGQPHNCLKETVVDGKTFFHAFPNMEYEAEVFIQPEHLLEVKAPNLYATLKIDGKCTGSSVLMTHSVARNTLSARFCHFHKGDKRIYFQFADVQRVEKDPGMEKEAEEENSLKDAGSFQVNIFRADLVVVDSLQQNRQQQQHQEKRLSVDEKKKFWKTPSLFTGGGRIVENKPIFGKSLENIMNIQTIRSYYHCPLVINILRNISSGGTPSICSNAFDPSSLSPSSTFSSKRSPSSLLVKREKPSLGNIKDEAQNITPKKRHGIDAVDLTATIDGSVVDLTNDD